MSNKKQIEDYLHLYLGCPVQTDMGKGTLEIVSTGHMGCAGSYSVFMAEDGGLCHETDLKWIKPILRKLSSMTEEEAIEVAKLSEWEPHFKDVQVERNIYSNDLVVSWQGSNESREEFNSSGELFYCSEQFIYLLSKHFDLFELIEYELATEQ